jgi:hypothetical protein
MMVGHLIGAFMCAFFSDYGHKQFNAIVLLMVNSLVSGLSCMLASASSNVIIVGLGLSLWSFSSEMILNFLDMLPTLFFPASMVKRIFSLIATSWPMYAVIVPTTIRIHQSWRMIMLLNLGLPHIAWSIYVWCNLKELTNIDNSELELI